MTIDFIAAPMLCVLMTAGGYGLVIFDRLVQSEYEHHRQQWTSDGEPRGIFWCPEGRRKNWRACSRLSWNWLVRTPTWAAGTANYRKALNHYRIANLVMYAVFLGYLVLVLMPLFYPAKIL